MVAGRKARTRPFSGVQPRRMANRSWSMMPSQKLAMARPDTVTTRSAWSRSGVAPERREHAERDAHEDGDDHATSVSSIVAGSRAARSSAIGRVV